MVLDLHLWRGVWFARTRRHLPLSGKIVTVEDSYIAAGSGDRLFAPLSLRHVEHNLPLQRLVPGCGFECLRYIELLMHARQPFLLCLQLRPQVFLTVAVC